MEFVYVRADDGSVLSRGLLIAAIDYQRTMLDEGTVANSLADMGSMDRQTSSPRNSPTSLT